MTIGSMMVLAAAVFAGSGEYDRLQRQVDMLDAAADRAWEYCPDKAAFEKRKAAMRKAFIDGIGGFPERTPLNARTTAVVRRDGYTIEKVLFESQPKHYVTALAFVPDPAKFKAPYPAVLVPCGHSRGGKDSAGYQRACVMGAKEGLLMLIYDPIDQGERAQNSVGWNRGPCYGHNTTGIQALRFGGSTARFRIWDGIRALDYLCSRKDVDGDRLGCMGNSGGGTLTSYLMALDPRIKAASPSCYISSIRAVTRAIGPQDTEQCIYGQLPAGLNHASLVLMGSAAVRLQVSEKDFFPLDGAKETFRVVKKAAEKFGLGGRYDMTVVAGPHGWKESSRRSSLDWMRQWLLGEKQTRTEDDYRALDAGFDLTKVDCGLPASEVNVTPTGSVADIPGSRSVYDIMRDEALAKVKAPVLELKDELQAAHLFYSSRDPSEEKAMLCQMLGVSLVEERMKYIFENAKKFGKPFLYAHGSWCVPARKAYEKSPELFAGIMTVDDRNFADVVRGELKDAVR